MVSRINAQHCGCPTRQVGCGSDARRDRPAPRSVGGPRVELVPDRAKAKFGFQAAEGGLDIRDPPVRPKDRLDIPVDVAGAQHIGARALVGLVILRPACVDAPFDASIFSVGSVHAVRCCRVSGLSMRHVTRRGPSWRCADRVHIAYQQRRHREQIQHPKRRPARRYPRERIHRCGAGKGLTDRAQRPVISRVMNQPQPHDRCDLDQRKLTAVKRMKRVRYPDNPPFEVSKGCI